jgi:N6-L-threonylcarbamoyladenine synthase
VSGPSITVARGPILCIETSCDDTSAAVVTGGEVLASIVSSQNELHAQFGGIVPEVASRRHTELVNTVVAETLATAGLGWDEITAVAVTVGPGLIGALLVCLVASGGHTLVAVVVDGVAFRLAGRTRDDAAGEAFDKGARLLGLGYPGGAELDRLAAAGDARFVRFPRALPRASDFSFSGLKTALLYYLRDQSEQTIAAHRADIAASYQAAIVRQLVDKTVRCAGDEGLRRVAVGGGVAANSGLRQAMAEACASAGIELFVPPRTLCTDNAAMIGLAAGYLPAIAWPEYLALDAHAAATLTG